MTTHSRRAERPGSSRAAWLAALGKLEAWLTSECVPYAVLGGVAVAAWADRGTSLDFDRQHAHDATQRMPDIDLLVPRDALARVKEYAETARRGDPPLKIDTVSGECYIDYRPDQARSYLTHRRLAFAVPTALFNPVRAPLLSREVATVDPRVLLGTFGTVGCVVRRKDEAKMAALTAAIESGAAPTAFTEAECGVFARYQAARLRRYPAFTKAKTIWEAGLAMLPAETGNMVLYYVSPPAQRAIGRLNRTHRAALRGTAMPG